jgi:hypothetical protein
VVVDLVLFPPGKALGFPLAVTAGMSLPGIAPGLGPPPSPDCLESPCEVLMALPPSWTMADLTGEDGDWAFRALLAAAALPGSGWMGPLDCEAVVMGGGAPDRAGYSAVMLARFRALAPEFWKTGDGPDAAPILAAVPLRADELELRGRAGPHRFLARFGDALLSGPVDPARESLAGAWREGPGMRPVFGDGPGQASPGPDLGLLMTDMGWLLAKGMGFGRTDAMKFTSPSGDEAAVLVFPAGPGQAFSLAVTAGMSIGRKARPRGKPAAKAKPRGKPPVHPRLEVFMALPPSWDGADQDDPLTDWATSALLSVLGLRSDTRKRLEEGFVVVLDTGFRSASGFAAVLLAKSRAVPLELQTLGEGPDAVELLCLAPLYGSEIGLPSGMGMERFLARFGDELLGGPVRQGRPPLPVSPEDAGRGGRG